MPRRLALLAAVLALAALAWWPLFRAGPLGEDLATLVDLSRLAWPEGGAHGLDAAELYGVRGAEGRPLGSLALIGLARLLAPGGRWTGVEVLVLRGVNLALLVGAAFGLARLVRRALTPRTGVESARAAGWASGALLLCHPLCIPLVARPSALGDLLGLAIGALAAHAFLKGRNERRQRWMVLAALLTVLCGFASELAYFLALLLGLIEMTLERQARTLPTRLRTTATTLAVFGAAASVELALRVWSGVEASPPRLVEVWVDEAGGPSLARTLSVAIEKLGLLVMPVPAHGGLGMAGLVLGGTALLVALEPALVAARSAPRLWGSLLGLWLLGLVLVELSGAGLRVDPSTLAGVEILFPAVVVVAAGLGTASAAVSGARRRVAPLAAALGYALLAHAAARPYPVAAAALAELRADLQRAKEQHPGVLALIVIDPPGRVRGLEVAGASLERLLDPALTGVPERTLVRGLDAQALPLWSRQPEFEALRARGLGIVAPPALFSGGSAPGGAQGADDGEPRALEHRVALRVAPSAPPADPLLWRSDARSPLVDLDPLAFRAARVGARADASTADPARMHWRAREELAASDELQGTWIEGREGPLALFDLEHSPTWLLGGRIARIWLDGEPLSAEVLHELPAEPALALAVEGDDWLFDGSEAGLPVPLRAEAEWWLLQLDLATLEQRTLQLERQGAGRLCAPGAANGLPGEVAWSLELRTATGAIARLGGRRAR